MTSLCIIVSLYTYSAGLPLTANIARTIVKLGHAGEFFWNHFQLRNFAGPVVHMHSIGGGIEDHIVGSAVGSRIQL